MVSCASASTNNKIMFDAPLVAIISQLDAYNLSSAYNFSGVIVQLDKRLMQSQIAGKVASSLTLDTALDSYANYGKQISSILVLVNQLSGLKCWWGNISLCGTCTKCSGLQEELGFKNNHNSLIAVETSIVAIIDAIRLETAALVDFVNAAKLDVKTLQDFRTAVVTQVQKSSDTVRSVAATLGSEWQCLGVNNALPDYRNFKSFMCDMNSKSATAIVQISCS